MDLISIISRVAPYALVALLAAVILIGGALFGYRIYRKRGGKYTVTKMQFAAFFLLIAWLSVVLGLTMFSRGANFKGWINFRLFSDYVNAWNNWSLSELQLIIFNMLMFMPLGFLLPMLGKRLRRFTPVLITTILVTVFVETTQMLTGTGIFELNDIFHNTIGSIAGYFLVAAILSCIERKKLTVKSLLGVLVIPLVFTVIFSCAAIVYHAKELGNLPIRPAIPQDTSKGKIQINLDLPETAEPVAMYYNKNIHNVEYGEKVLSIVKEQFLLDQIGGRRIDGSNRVYSLRDDLGLEYYFTFSLSDGSWTLTKNEPSEKLPKEETLRNQRQIIEKWFIESKLMPSNSGFSLQNKDTLRWDKEAPSDIHLRNRSYSSGIIMVQVSDDLLVPQSMFYAMVDFSYVRNVDIISPMEAFEQVKRGNFEQYNDLKEDYLLNIDNYSLTYVYDTKGYYRPAYQFGGTLDGEDWSCLIPAM